jgi:hypothetical protein
VSPSYFTRVVRLSYLAPDITQAILDGHQPRDLRYRIDLIKIIFHPIRRHRSETVLNSRGVDLCPPASGGPAASASIGGPLNDRPFTDPTGATGGFLPAPQSPDPDRLSDRAMATREQLDELGLPP